jgi:hypothetical protein
MQPMIIIATRPSPMIGVRHLNRLLTLSASVLFLAGCGASASDQTPQADDATKQAAPQAPQQATLPAKLCDLFPQADAERIMGKPLKEQRNDDAGCHYQDAKGTGGTGVSIDTNILSVADQCRLVSGSEPLAGVGSEACIAIGNPVGMYTTVVFSGKGQTFEATAPGRDKASELATAVAKVVLAKLGS